MPSARAPLISMHGWGLRSALIGLSAPGSGSGSSLQIPSWLFLPSHHAHACWVPHDSSSRTCRPCSPVQWTSVTARPTESREMVVKWKGFPGPSFFGLHISYVIIFPLVSQGELFSVSPHILCHFASHVFPVGGGGGESQKLYKNILCTNPVCCHFCPFIWFSTAPVPPQIKETSSKVFREAL